jgi:hypothetical protein
LTALLAKECIPFLYDMLLTIIAGLTCIRSLHTLLELAQAHEACNDRQQHIIQKGNAFFCEECRQPDLYDCILKNESDDIHEKGKARMDGFETAGYITDLSGWAYGRQYVSPWELPKALVNKCLAKVCPIAAQQKGYY